eukprot:scaffold45751_cov29-Tisochrysis_lutea.AAC.3
MISKRKALATATVDSGGSNDGVAVARSRAPKYALPGGGDDASMGSKGARGDVGSSVVARERRSGSERIWVRVTRRLAERACLGANDCVVTCLASGAPQRLFSLYAGQDHGLHKPRRSTLHRG